MMVIGNPQGNQEKGAWKPIPETSVGRTHPVISISHYSKLEKREFQKPVGVGKAGQKSGKTGQQCPDIWGKRLKKRRIRAQRNPWLSEIWERTPKRREWNLVISESESLFPGWEVGLDSAAF
jgi:hypothetical protein